MGMFATVGDVADDLVQFGEGEASRWIETCTDEEFVRVCNVAEFLLYCGPSAPSGASMMLAKACAISAVYVFEGAPRRLARGRRSLRANLPSRSVSAQRRTNVRLQQTMGRYAGVGDDLIDFWTASPESARDHLRKAREHHGGR